MITVAVTTMRPCVWCVRGPDGVVSRTSPWWRCWRSSFSLWTRLNTAPTCPWSEEAADPGPGWEGPTWNDASLAAFQCKAGSPARAAGTCKTLLAPCRKGERWGKRKRSREWAEVRSDYVGKRGLKLKPKNIKKIIIIQMLQYGIGHINVCFQDKATSTKQTAVLWTETVTSVNKEVPKGKINPIAVHHRIIRQTGLRQTL